MAKKRFRHDIIKIKKQVVHKSCTPVKNEQPIEDPLVIINVTPAVNINGFWYAGQCKVKQSIASQLQRIIQESEREKIKAQTDQSHSTIHVAQVGKSGGIEKSYVKHIYS